MTIRVTNWINEEEYDAAEDRLLIGGITTTPGVDSHKSFYVTQKATPTMKADVAAGSAFVNGTSQAHQGQYHVYNDGNIEVSFKAAHSTMNRIDLVSLLIEDKQYTGITPTKVSVVVTQGVAASSPVRPNSPPDSLDLASVLVKKGATKIANSDIQVIAPRATALGGIAYARNYEEMTERLPRIDGLHVYRKDIDRLMVCDGSSWNYINSKPILDTGWKNINVSSKYQMQKTQYRVYGDMVFTRGAIGEYQKNAKKTKRYNDIGTLPKSYAPTHNVQVMSGIEAPGTLGANFWNDGRLSIFYTKPTSSYCFIDTSWLLG